MAMAKFCLRTAPGIDRPAIAAFWPTLRGESIVLDCGATIGADAKQLFDFAIMGGGHGARPSRHRASDASGSSISASRRSRAWRRCAAPAQLLREADLPGLEYSGFVEGDDIGKGTVDVVVTEGFAGNIALKTAEGTARQIAVYLRAAMSRTLLARIGYFLARGAFDRLREKMDPRRVNGGVFLGLNGIVIKSHGGTDAEGFAAAIEIGYSMARNGLLDKINQDLAVHRKARAEVVRKDRRSGWHVNDLRSVVLGCGGYLPAKVLTNDDLSRIVDTTDEWITQRTGIRKRHIAADGELTSDLATEAARAALADAGVAIDEIDLIVMATATPDHTFPAAAVTVQQKLGMTHGAAFDIQAVCSGFLFALTTADALIKAGQARKALVIGAETFSRILDWTDRATCVLFGDGAGAVVLARRARRRRDRGILAAQLRSDGRYKDKLYVDGGPSTTRTVGHLRMEGREVYRHAVTMISDVIEEAFAATGFTADDIDWFVPHQANVRIIDASAKKLGIAEREGDPHRRSPRQHLGRLDPARPLRRRRATAASSAATFSSSKRWAAASPGVRCSSAGEADGRRHHAEFCRRTLASAKGVRRRSARDAVRRTRYRTVPDATRLICEGKAIRSIPLD